MADYKIDLGVQLNKGDLGKIKTDLNNIHQQKKINLDLNMKSINHQIRSIKNQIQDLSKSKINIGVDSKDGVNAVSIDTTKITKSFNELKDAVVSIKSVLGTVDDTFDAKTIVSSISQIANTLGKATDESQNLINSLNALSKKDFSVNVDIKMGGNNSVKNNTDYSNYVKNTVIPQLEQQARELENYIAKYYGKSDGMQGLQKLFRGLSYNGDINNSAFRHYLNDLMPTMSNTSGRVSLKDQMKAFTDYFDLLQEVASLRNGARGEKIDLGSVTSGFEHTAQEYVEQAEKIRSGTKAAEESVSNLKNLLGSGISDDALRSILDDLNAIKKALETLSSKESLGGLTSSFEQLSVTLKEITKNMTAFKQAVNTGVSNGANIGSNVEKEVKNISNTLETAGKQGGQRLGDAIEKGVENSFDLDKVINDEVNSLMSMFGITGQKAFSEIKSALIEYRTSLSAATESTDDFVDEWEIFSSSSTTSGIDKVRDALLNNMKVVDDTKQSYKELLEYIQAVNRGNGKIHLPQSIKEEYGDAFSKMRSGLGKAFTTGDGGDFESWVVELNAELGNIIDLSYGAEAAFLDLYNKVQSAKGSKFMSADEIISSGYFSSDDIKGIESLIESSVNNINEAQENAQKQAVESANVVVQSEEKKQQAAKETTQTVKQSADAIEKVGQVAGKGSNNFGLKETQSDLSKLKSLAREIGNLDFKIVKSNFKGESAKVEEFQRQLELAKTKYNSLVQSLSAKGIDISVTTTDEFVKARNKIAELEKTFQDARAKLAEDIKIDIKVGGDIHKNFNDVQAKFNGLSHASAELTDDMKLLNTAFQSMETASAQNDIEALIKANTEYEQVLKRVKNQLANTVSGQERVNLSKEMGVWLKDNSASAKLLGDRIRKLQAELKNCDKQRFNGIKKEFREIQLTAKDAGKNVKTFGDSIKDQFKKYSSYFSVASVFMYAEQGLRDMFEQVKLIDSAMTELKKVTDETDESYNKFLTNAAARAKEIGTTIDGLVASTADFARLGYGFEDAQGLAEVANIYAVVGDEVEGVEGATESLISTMAAFKDEMNGLSNTDFAMSLIDKMNEVGNNFAISSGGIGEALKRASSSMSAANNTVDETIALITAAIFKFG